MNINNQEFVNLKGKDAERIYIYQLSAPMYFKYGNAGLWEILGYGKDRPEKFDDSFYINAIVKTDREKFQEYLERSSQRQGKHSCEYQLMKKDGSLISVIDTMETIQDSKGKLYGYARVTENNVVERKLPSDIQIPQNHVQMNSDQLHELLKYVGILSFKYDIKNHYCPEYENLEEVMYYTPRQYWEMLCLLKEEHGPEGQNIGNMYYFVHREDRDGLEEKAFELQNRGEVYMNLRLLCGDHKYHWFEVKMYVSKENRNIVMGYMYNIDVKAQKFESLKKQASTDMMTGVLNKVAGFKKINKYLMKRSKHLHAMLFMDLDNFKIINDTCGHDAGDEAIIFFAETLKSVFREEDVVLRFGGDEFMVFMKNIKNKEIAFQRARVIQERCKKWRCTDEPGVKLSTSIGIAFSEGHPTTGEELFKEADEMLYKAKTTKKGTIVGNKQ